MLTFRQLASRDMVTYDTIEREEYMLEPEGQQIASKGRHVGNIRPLYREEESDWGLHVV